MVRGVKRGVLEVQEYLLLVGQVARGVVTRPFYARDVVEQLDAIGIGSLTGPSALQLAVQTVEIFVRNAPPRADEQSTDGLEARAVEFIGGLGSVFDTPSRPRLDEAQRPRTGASR